MYVDPLTSRYAASRYDSESRRSRSRDRSPDRRSLYSDGGPRRSSAESRSNAAAFQTNRDSFRDTLPRDPPRGPKALLDPPSGPRGGGYSGEFRGRGGRGRGRGWRDDSRDRGREREIDFRDRRDTAYRDERSRERDRLDWRDRDRESFRGRRPSPHARDGPPGLDAERVRRGSRDGPLSAGSSSSDPPFAHSTGRGGDWDRGRGRPFYDDRDRDDRDRDNRYPDPDPRTRDFRDDRDIRDREPRPKLERTSHEPPTANKDLSPPPLAPAASSFGSVPSRLPSAGEVGSVTGKAPPTGPRALKEDRPPLSNASSVDTRAPPSPPVAPSGPRSHSQRTGPSSKQWINPNLKHREPNQRPPSRDAKLDVHIVKSEDLVRGLHITVSGEHPRVEPRPRSADGPHSVKADIHSTNDTGIASVTKDVTSGPVKVSEPAKQPIGDIIESGIAKVEQELKHLEAVEDAISMDPIIATEPEGLEDMPASIPDETPAEPAKPAPGEEKPQDHTAPLSTSSENPRASIELDTDEPPVEGGQASTEQPKTPAPPPLPIPPRDSKNDETDIEDVGLDSIEIAMNTPRPELDRFILERLGQRKEEYVAVKSRGKFTFVPGASDSGPNRYASERDLERVLEESRRAESRTDKEAVIPRQYQTEKERQDEFYSSNTGFIRPEKIVAAWEVLPPVDNFTDEETSQWGRFYYLKKEKEDLNLKEKLRKQPKKRKRGGRGKTRSSALTTETAAPTFNSEATPATDGESGTPAGTPGRRDKEPKPPRVTVPLAAAPAQVPPGPPVNNKGNRSRSTSRVQGPDWSSQLSREEGSRLLPQYDPEANVGQPAPSTPMHVYPQQPPPMHSLERNAPPPMADVMAPPPLRPEPPAQPAVAVLDVGHTAPPDRKSGGQPSSYWSVPEATEFPSLLRSFGSDWAAIAAHMRTKTTVMALTLLR
ncbi:hypothetical protein F5Y17DRAFT_467387 [Xylariaceae sp. FL0594]|nr:hypothetical protein F5Y17DRAFT_467387 [Xylariaceae sp. FL0594]